MQKSSLQHTTSAQKEKKNQYHYKLLFLFLLSAAGGCVDALSYLGLGEVFTANMTGNTVFLGVKLVYGDIHSAFLSGLSLVGFFTGLSIAFMMTEGKQGELFQSQCMIKAAVLEEGLLAALAVFVQLTNGAPGNWVSLLVFIASAAMGIQSTMTRRINLRGVATTYITGMMVAAVEGILKNVLSSRRRKATDDNQAAETKENWGFQLSSWVIYLIGGVIGGWFTLHHQKYFGWTAVVIIGLAMIVMLIYRFDKRMIDKLTQSKGSGKNVSG
ncbi:YoaK family protein [Scopulibacillus cellulosilyticus]|uniref:YoaK family protein n=1 Tax=Scopulibacillus cellulosilyticus TaxID=2665665 RepID=A0ABW2Q039_9BACL